MSTRGQNLVICATCGERRPADEMAGVQRGKWTDWYCLKSQPGWDDT